MKLPLLRYASLQAYDPFGFVYFIKTSLPGALIPESQNEMSQKLVGVKIKNTPTLKVAAPCVFFCLHILRMCLRLVVQWSTVHKSKTGFLKLSCSKQWQGHEEPHEVHVPT